MKHINRPADVQPSTIPARSGRVRVNADTCRRVPSANLCRGVPWCLGSRWDRWQHVAVRPAELEPAIVASLDLKAFFVNGSVVPATQQNEVGERGGAALGPVFDVMSLAEGEITAWEAAAVIAEGHRAP